MITRKQKFYLIFLFRLNIMNKLCRKLFIIWFSWKYIPTNISIELIVNWNCNWALELELGIGKFQNSHFIWWRWYLMEQYQKQVFFFWYFTFVCIVPYNDFINYQLTYHWDETWFWHTRKQKLMPNSFLLINNQEKRIHFY